MGYNYNIIIRVIPDRRNIHIVRVEQPTAWFPPDKRSSPPPPPTTTSPSSNHARQYVYQTAVLVRCSLVSGSFCIRHCRIRRRTQYTHPTDIIVFRNCFCFSPDRIVIQPIRRLQIILV